MPVKLGSKLPGENEARIEIIPLIDIMFFLLAAFMLVSLSAVQLKSVKVNLPTATQASPDAKQNLLTISVTKAGAIFLEGRPVGNNELASQLASIQKTNPNVRVLIHGDQDARHGDVVGALDIVRSAGIEQAGLEIRDPRKDGQ